MSQYPHPYEGERLYSCPQAFSSLSNISVVLVSGASMNPCGHTLLAVGPRSSGLYCHVSELLGYPRIMTEASYRRYLIENGKDELRRTNVKLPRPHDAEIKLNELITQQYLWLVIFHNCETFVQKILHAGGLPDAKNPFIFNNFLRCPSYDLGYSKPAR